jgi:N-carbamoylputrescine amidase
MRVTVCELNDDPEVFEEEWGALAAHVKDEASELVLLPEMPFYGWFPRSAQFEAAVWGEALAAHDRWLERLAELAPAAVLGSRPVERKDGQRLNEGFIWVPAGGYREAHAKHYLPDEEGFWEASWYGRGEGDFTPADCGGAHVGFAICTELWFLERARAYGRQGVHILASPRGTLLLTVEKWLVGGRAAAIAAGAYSLSSNRVSRESSWPVFGGQGWVVSPEGEILALTSRQRPFVTVEIDLQEAERAKGTYPRYVEE